MHTLCPFRLCECRCVCSCALVLSEKHGLSCSALSTICRRKITHLFPPRSLSIDIMHFPPSSSCDVLPCLLSKGVPRLSLIFLSAVVENIFSCISVARDAFAWMQSTVEIPSIPLCRKRGSKLPSAWAKKRETTMMRTPEALPENMSFCCCCLFYNGKSLHLMCCAWGDILSSGPRNHGPFACGKPWLQAESLWMS